MYLCPQLITVTGPSYPLACCLLTCHATLGKKTSYQVKSMEKFSMKYQPSPRPWLTTLLHEIFTTLQFRELRVAIFRDFEEI